MKLVPIRTALVALALVAVILPTAPAPAAAQADEQSHITINTYGWGHGVGMGQYGAQGMALQGSTYHQILAHFYTGTHVGPPFSTAQWDDVRVQIRETDSAVDVRTDGAATLRVSSSASGGNVTMAAGERVQINTEGTDLVARVYGTNGAERATRRIPTTQSPWFAVRMGSGATARTLATTWGETRYRHGEIVVHGGRPQDCYRQAGSPPLQHCVGVRGMTMNQYLEGLAEMPGGWHPHALRAQAVAGRTYAAPRIAGRHGNLFHLRDSVLHQAWRGDQGPGSNWPDAVYATGNEINRYGNQLADAFYHSSSGGHTENSEYVWTAALPWARGVPDPGDSVAPNSPRGEFDVTSQELTTWLREHQSYPEVRNITDVVIEGNIGVSGRTDRANVRIVGHTTFTMTGPQFRQLVNARAGGSRQIITTNYRIDTSGLGVSGDRLTSASGIALADVGYWVTNPAGAVSARNFAPFHGSMQGQRLNQPVLGMAANPRGTGYWLVASDGGIFSFGNLHFHGSTGNMRLNQPVVGMGSTHTGNGYWLVARDGGIFSFGDARFHGSTGAMRLNQPVVGMARTPTGQGYWLVARDGGIFAFGDARFYGSTGSIRLNEPIVAMAPTPTGRGYWLLARDGGVFAFGDARYRGRLEGKQAVGIAPTRSGQGYWIVASDGSAYRYGDD